MSVIPLTLTISLCLVFTFLVFFLREHSKARMGSSERDSMLPFSGETPREGGEPVLVVSFKGRQPGQTRAHAHDHHGQGGCSSNKPDHERCPDCAHRHRGA